MDTSLAWSADFETTTDKEDCRVWAYALSNIANPHKFLYGNSIDKFMTFCANEKYNDTLYFFNLKFDGAFILSWLLKHGYTRVDSPKERRTKTFSSLITDKGAFYSIEIFFDVKGKHTNKVKIIDAMKIFPNFSVERLAESFGLPISKLELDYDEKREIGHELTPHEIDYIRNDVEIVAWALKAMLDKGLTRMTIASNAMKDFKKRCKNFRKYFPTLTPEIDKDIRTSYRGGFTYLSNKYVSQEQGKGITIDVNSLYPSVMRKEPLPTAQPIFFEGEYEEDPLHPLYVQTLSCRFKLKPNKIPCIQLRNTSGFIANEYLTSSNNHLITLTLTNIDLKLFYEQYEVYDKSFSGGWKFRATSNIFDDYIDYWTEEKITAGKEGNKGRRQIAKLMLNSLY